MTFIEFFRVDYSIFTLEENPASRSKSLLHIFLPESIAHTITQIAAIQRDFKNKYWVYSVKPNILKSSESPGKKCNQRTGPTSAKIIKTPNQIQLSPIKSGFNILIYLTNNNLSLSLRSRGFRPIKPRRQPCWRFYPLLSTPLIWFIITMYKTCLPTKICGSGAFMNTWNDLSEF